MKRGHDDGGRDNAYRRNREWELQYDGGAMVQPRVKRRLMQDIDLAVGQSEYEDFVSYMFRVRRKGKLYHYATESFFDVDIDNNLERIGYYCCHGCNLLFDRKVLRWIDKVQNERPTPANKTGEYDRLTNRDRELVNSLVANALKERDCQREMDFFLNIEADNTLPA